MKALVARLERAAARPQLMDAMMARLGIDAEAASARDVVGLAFAARRCAGCGHEEACRAFLAETERADHAPAFCGNANYFEAIERGL